MPSPTSIYHEIVANAALVLIGVAVFLLTHQMTAQAESFKKEGGFKARLYCRQMNWSVENEHELH